jgi:hypothetical protein
MDLGVYFSCQSFLDSTGHLPDFEATFDIIAIISVSGWCEKQRIPLRAHETRVVVAKPVLSLACCVASESPQHMSNGIFCLASTPD